MSEQAVQSLRRFLRQVSDEATLKADAQLLRQFIEANDHRAFEILLVRHGPMVLGTARRLVNHAADADDVFQAVFLSLARLAQSIRQGQSVPNWLYTTTCRIAVRTRKQRAIPIESAPEPFTATTPETDLVWREVRSALDEELQRLPERLRAPLLLCYLSGLTRDEAAERLGWSISTLRRRLEEGRAALRTRMERRGIAPAALALAVLSPTNLNAVVCPALAKKCLDAVSVGTGAVGATALVLTSTTTLKNVAMKAAIVSLALAGLTIGIYASSGWAEPSKPAEAKKPDEPKAMAKRVDSLGDPLPEGAVMRLGTRRHRVLQHHPALAFRWQTRADGKSYLAVQGNGEALEVRRIDVTTGVAVEAWPIAEGDQVVSLTPDGRYVLFEDKYARYLDTGLVERPKKWHATLYDLAERKPVWTTAKELAQMDVPHLSDCVFSADNKWYVTGSGVIRLWDGQTGRQLWEHRRSLSAVGFVHDGDTVVLRNDNDGTIHLFDRSKGTEKKSFPTSRPQSWGRNLISPDGNHLIFCTTQPPTVWDLEGKKVAVLDGHITWANVAAFSPDGKKLFTGSYDSFVIEREWPSGKQVRKIELGRDRVNGMAVSPDGKRLEVVFEGEQSLCFYDLETGKRLPEPLDSHRSVVYSVECAADGSLVSFGSDRSVRTWDLKQRKSVAQFAVDLDLNGRGFALNADGTRVAVPSYDVKSIDIFDRRTGKRLRNIPADHFSGFHLAFSPDDRFLSAVVGSNRSAQIWDMATGAQVLKVKARNACNTVAGAFSPDGRTFAFGDGGQVRMWDTATWKEGTGMQIVAPWGLARMEYSPDGRTIATASEFGDGVRLYEVATRRERAHVQPPGSTTGLLRFSHDGRALAWVNNHHKIHVLDVRTGVLAGPFSGHDDRITGLAFTTEDKALASSSADSTILVWDLSTKGVAKTASDGVVDEDWQTLQSEDARRAYTAMRSLATRPETALKVVGERLRPAEPLDPQWVAARLKDLDNPKFAERERATRELEVLGDRIVASLERFLDANPSAEASGRAERLLKRIRGRILSGQAAQSLRALEVLEWIGKAKARELVEKLAKGADGASLTEQAKRCLERWKSPEE